MMLTRRLAAVTTAALTLAGAQAALAPVASASTRLPTAAIGASLAGPTGVAVDRSNGNVYVSESSGSGNLMPKRVCSVRRSETGTSFFKPRNKSTSSSGLPSC